jgi:uncharacterized paraquat-inducible protein A
MPKWTLPSSYSSLVLVLMLAATSVGVAWISFNLIGMAMENANLLTHEGLMGAIDGGFAKLLILLAKGVAVLFLYLVFRGAEQELLRRWTGVSDRD